MNKNNIFKNKMQTKQLKKTYIKKRFAEPVTQIIRPDKLIKNKLKIITKPIFLKIYIYIMQNDKFFIKMRQMWKKCE